MPHHESGLLALHTTDSAVIDRAVQHFVRLAPHPCVEVVRGAGGKGVWLCFGSFIDTDVSAFRNSKNGAALAKALKQPLWVGHAVGGYSNSQTAMAFSAAGKQLWRSEFDFNFPPELLAKANDPFSAPERRHELIKELRASNGYGLIGTEFGLDYFRILDINAGDALFATDKRKLDEKKGAKEHAKWLTGKFKPPEGEPGDGAEPPDEQGSVGYRFLSVVDASRFGAALAELLKHRGESAGDVKVTHSSSKKDTVIKLEGRGVRALSTTLLSPRFVGLLAVLHEASTFAYGWNEKEAPRVCAGQSYGADMLGIVRAQRDPLRLTGKFSPVALKATAAQAKKIAKLREALSNEDD